MIISAISMMSIGATVYSAFQVPPDAPVLASPAKYRLELFYDFQEQSGSPKAFQLTFAKKGDGVAPGLYVTSGPLSGQESDRLFFFGKDKTPSVLISGLNSNESILFAKGNFGKGIIVAEGRALRLSRFDERGRRESTRFATIGTSRFGPACMTYGHDGMIYVADFFKGNIMRVTPDGSATVFAKVPLPISAFGHVVGEKETRVDTTGRYGGGYLTGVFNGGPTPENIGSIYKISRDGKTIRKFVGGLNGLELFQFGPGGKFSKDLYVCTQGSDLPNDGGVFVVNPTGKVTPFLWGIDAASVAFDTEGICGGGMFIADFANGFDRVTLKPVKRAGRIWRITPQ